MLSGIGLDLVLSLLLHDVVFFYLLLFLPCPSQILPSQTLLFASGSLARIEIPASISYYKKVNLNH